MSFSIYDRMGIIDAAARGFPAVPETVETALGAVEESVAAKILCLLDPLQEQGMEGISAAACFKLLGYGKWFHFLRVATGLERRKPVLLPVHYEAVYADKVSGLTNPLR